MSVVVSVLGKKKIIPVKKKPGSRSCPTSGREAGGLSEERLFGLRPECKKEGSHGRVVGQDIPSEGNSMSRDPRGEETWCV